MKHVYTINLSTRRHTIEISPSTRHGYFEHVNGEYEGSLTFSRNNGRVLIDYDGVSELPVDVINALIRAGYTTDDEWQGASFEADEIAEARNWPAANASAARRHMLMMARRIIAIGC